jgi:hypothetical protein
VILTPLVLFLQASNPATLDLLCTTSPRGQFVRYLFHIDGGADTYTAKLNDQYDLKGTAVVTDDTITLTSRGEKISMRYLISRTTGDMRIEAGLNGTGPAETRNGSCSKYSGKAF